jgi:putative membrane protein
MSKFSYKFFAGFCMGIAEITPGISGATIAGLFNVYKDFVNFLNVFNPLKIKPNLSYFYKEINFSFIIPLLLGMAISIYLSAFAIDYFRKSYLYELKIFLSAVMLIAVIKNCGLDQSLNDSFKYILDFILGLLIAIVIALSLVELDFNNSFLLVLAGLLAFTAFLLPGISGSLVLIILGVYGNITTAIKDIDVIFLMPFIIGMAISFLVIPAQIIKRINDNEVKTKVFFSGLILGSIPAVWLYLI